MKKKKFQYVYRFLYPNRHRETYSTRIYTWTRLHCRILLFPPALTTRMFSALRLTKSCLLSLCPACRTQRQSQGFLSSQGFVRYETGESCLSARKWGEACQKSLQLFLHSTLLQGNPSPKWIQYTSLFEQEKQFCLDVNIVILVETLEICKLS